MIDVKLVGADGVVKWCRATADGMGKSLRKGLTKAALVIERGAKRIVYAGHDAHLEGDTGRLRQSISHKVSGLAAYVGTNVVYARIHEFGGTILPKRVKYLSIPVGDYKDSPTKHDLDWRPGGHGGLLVDASGKVQYVLVSQVTIPPRPYLGPALEQHGPEAAKTLENTLLEDIRE